MAYPGAAVYFYTLVNLASGRNVTWNFGQLMHIPIDFFRMWLLVKVLKLALGKRVMTERKMYVFFMALF